MKALRALCPEPQNYSDAGLAAFAELFELHAARMTQAELEASAPEYDVLLIRLEARVRASLLARCPSLKLIVSPTTGVDHIDLVAAEAAGVAVLTLRGETGFLRTVSSTAEHTWALLLGLVRQLVAATDSVRRGEWQQATFRGWELRGKVLGIVGLGRLGSMVANYGHAFGMRVVATDPNVATPPPPVEAMLPLDALLSVSDVVSLHVPLSTATHHMIDKKAIDRMKSAAVLVNTSRGAVVDEEALVDALRRGAIAGAALDVLSDETPAGRETNPLLAYHREHENLVITPHIGGASDEAIERTDSFLADRTRAWLQNHPASSEMVKS